MIGSQFKDIISRLGRLPGLGPRSARRLVLFLLKNRHNILLPLIESLKAVHEEIKTCSVCHNLDVDDPCFVCTDYKRSDATLCIVADVSDIWAIERSQTFKGHYHVLGGLLSVSEGITPSQLHIESLLNRIDGIKNSLQEIIIALNATIEGQTTMHVVVNSIHEKFIDNQFNITTLAQGLPIGGELDYLDDGTLWTAFSRRHNLNAA